MPGIGPITNTRTLKSALDESIDKLELITTGPAIKKLLARCRSFRTLVEAWDAVSPPADEQFETIGQIMQLLGEAMNVIKLAESAQAAESAQSAQSAGSAQSGGSEGKDEPGNGARALATVDHDPDELTDVSAHDAPADVPRSHLIELYLEPWTFVGAGVAVKVVRPPSDGEPGIALMRLKPNAELTGQYHGAQEHIFVLEGCVRHAGMVAHAGSCIRIDAGSDSSPVQALGEATLLLIDTERACVAAG